MRQVAVGVWGQATYSGGEPDYYFGGEPVLYTGGEQAYYTNTQALPQATDFHEFTTALAAQPTTASLVTTSANSISFTPAANGNPAKITQMGGSWAAEGFLAGDQIAVSGTGANENDGSYIVGSISSDGTILFLAAGSILVAETSVPADVSVATEPPSGSFVGSSNSVSLTFTAAANGKPAAITRSAGSWISDGFLPGDQIAVSGTNTTNDSTYVVASISSDGTILFLAVGSNLLNMASVPNVTVKNSAISTVGTAYFRGVAGITILGGSGNNIDTIVQTQLGAFGTPGTDSTPITLDTGNGNDQVAIRSIESPVTVQAGTGIDAIDVGSEAGLWPISQNGPPTFENIDGFVADISVLLTILGGGGNATINVDDTGDPLSIVGALTSTNIIGLLMADGIVYQSISTVNINLGPGNDFFTIVNTAAATLTNIQGGTGEQVLNVQTTAGATTVNPGPGQNTINVGSLAGVNGWNYNGVLAGLQGALSVQGGSEPGFDSLVIDDSGDATARIAALTANQLTGLGMTQAGIAYGGIAALYVRLGSGVDNVNVASTHSGTTNINGGPASDTFTVTSVSGATEIQGEDPSIPAPEIFTNLVAATSVTVQQLLSAFTVTVVVNGVLQSIGTDFTLAVASQQIEFVQPVTGAVEVLFSENFGNLVNATYVLVHPILDSTTAVTVLLNGLTQTYGTDFTFALGTQRINFNNPVTGTIAVEFNDPTEPSAETFANLSSADSVTVQPILMGARVVSVLVNNVPQIFGTDYTFALGTQQIDFFKPVTGTVQVSFASNYERNPAVSQTETGHTDSFLVNVTALGAETHQNGVGALLAIDPQFGTNTISVYLTGKTNPESSPVSLIDVHDSGPGTDVNTLQIYGANNPQVGDQFLVRANFVAMLQLSGGQSVAAERVNYDSTANGGVIIYGRQGNDYFALDDTSAPLSIIGGQGSDVFQVGQLYSTDNIHPQNPFDYDTLALTATTQGFLSNGISEPATLQGGIGADTFTVFSNLATLTLIGGATDNVFTVRAFALAGSQPDDTARKMTDIIGGRGINLIEYAVNAPVNILGGAGTNTVVVLGSELGDTFVVTPQGVFGAGLFASMTGIQYLKIDGLAGDNNFEVVGTDPGVVTHIYGGIGSNTFDVGGTPNNQPTRVAANDQQGYSQLISQTTTSSDSSYQGITVGGISANVTDADQAGVVITPIGLMQVVSGMTTAAELSQAGGDGSQYAAYSVVLSREPQADQVVHVTVSGNRLPASQQQVIEFYDPTSGTFVVSRVLTFNSSNWAAPQTVYVVAPFNATTPGAQQELTQNFNFGSGGGESASFNLSSAASAILAVSVSGQALASSEYSLSGLSVSLNLPTPAAPNASVAVDYLSPDGATSTQYIQNSVKATNPVTPIPAYANYIGATARSLPLEVVASSAAGVVLTPTDPTSGLAETGTTVFKGGAGDAFTVVLTAAPLSGETVTVNLGTESGLVFTENGVAITSLRFNSSDWSVPVLVNVSDPQDNVIQGQFATTITATVTTNVTAAGGSLYAGVAATVLPVTVVDDNASGVFTQQTGGSTDLLEGGTQTAQAPFSATYTVVLTKRPSANVTVIETR